MLLRRHLRLAFACALLLPWAAPGAAVEVSLITIDGDELAGALAAIDPQAGVRVRDQSVPLDRIAEIRFKGVAAVGAKDKPRIRLRNGDVLHAMVLSGDDKALRVQSALLGELSIKNDILLGVVFPIVEPPAEAVVAQFFAEPDPRQDRFLTPKGESVGCFLERFSDTELALDVAGQKRALPLNQVAAFRYAALKPFPAAQGVQALARLGDGSLLSGGLKGFAADKVSLVAPDGTAWTVPAAAIRSIGFKGGKLVFLSDLEPEAEERPLVGGAPMVFRWRRDLSVAGERLRIGRREYARGLGTHSYCRLAYDLGGAYAQFLAEVGLDAGATPGSVCAWKALGDGKELASGEARAGGDPQKLRLAVAGVRKLELICDYGPDQDDAGDHLDWAEARLLKE
jgi:hypothetical protein